MNNTIIQQRIQRSGHLRYSFIGICLIVLFSNFQTSGQAFILDLEYNPMSFTNAQRTVLTDPGSNGGLSQGAVHKYSNVVTRDGITIYAIMTILEISNATINTFDDDTENGIPSRFQPQIGAGSGGGYILYQLEFFNTADDEEVFLFDYYVTGIDVDGNNMLNREYAEFGGYSGYQVNNPTQLVISTNPATGRTRFLGRTTSLSGITFDNTCSYIVNYSNPNNRITFALGQTGQNTERLYSVQFGVAGGAFTNPVNVPNPLPVAVDDIGSPVQSNTGGVAVGNILDNDTYNGLPVIPGNVTISVISPASDPGVALNASNGEVTVATGTPAGDYTIVYQICMVSIPGDCDLATITVSVISLTGPIVVDNSAFTDQGIPVDINVLNNDLPGSGAIDPTTVTMVPGTEPDATTVGTFTVNGITGLVTFSPVPSFSGVTTVDYQVCDVNSLCGDATISVTVFPDNDTDGDGIPDPDDDYPTDPDRAFDNYYPASGYGTLAFEDLWPGQGDYDFNDLVTDYQFQMVTNASNNLVEVFGTFIVKAFGASLHNGFGFQLANSSIDQAHLNVTGYELSGSYISLTSNGLENGQAKPTFILFDDNYALMEHPGTGTGVNTTPGAPYVTPYTLHIYIGVTSGDYSLNELDIENFNPFLIAGQVRGYEIHLPDYPPTSLADGSLFGQAQDDSNPSANRYYKSENNLPWAVHLYESFDYPQEQTDIIEVYNHFVEWAISGGNSYPDWYLDLPGYRNTSLIY